MANLATKLALSYFIILAVVLSLLGFVYFTDLEPDLRSGIQNSLKERSFLAANEINDFVQSRYEEIRLVAENPIIMSGRDAGTKLQELSILRVSLGYDDLALIDAQGNVVVSTRENAANWVNNKWFLEASSGSTSFARMDDKKNVLVFSPVLENGEINYVVAGWTDLDKLNRKLDAMKWDSGFIFVTNQEGGFVYHPVSTQILKQASINSGSTSGVAEFQENGRDMIAGYSTVQGNKDYKMDRWTVFATQPKESAFLLIGNIFNSFLFVFVLIAAAILLLGFIIVRSVTKPLNALRDGVKRIASGDFSYKLSAESNDEIGELAGSINEIRGIFKEKELQTRLKTDLQKKVKDLEKLNKIMIERETTIKKLKKEVKKLKK